MATRNSTASPACFPLYRSPPFRSSRIRKQLRLWRQTCLHRPCFCPEVLCCFLRTSAVHQASTSSPESPLLSGRGGESSSCNAAGDRIVLTLILCRLGLRVRTCVCLSACDESKLPPLKLGVRNGRCKDQLPESAMFTGKHGSSGCGGSRTPHERRLSLESWPTESLRASRAPRHDCGFAGSPTPFPGVRVRSSSSISHASIKHLVVSCLCPIWAHICSLYSVNPFWSEVLKISFESLSYWRRPCSHRGFRNTCDIDSVSRIACLG